MSRLSALSDCDLVHSILARERDLVRARFRHSLNQLENSSSLRALRKEIARLKTEVGARERASGVNKGTLMQTHRKVFVPVGPSGDSPSKGGFLSGIVDKLGANE